MEIFKAVLLMLLLGGIIGMFLGVAGEKLYVKEDTRVEDVLAMLPGYNCGGCGNPGCAGMAATVKPANGDSRSGVVAIDNRYLCVFDALSVKYA